MEFGVMLLLAALVSLGVVLICLLGNHLAEVARERQRRLIDFKAACPSFQPGQECVDESDFQECAICLGDLVERQAADSLNATMLRRLPCGHTFHACCIDGWVAAGRGCPMCRKCPLQSASTAASEVGRAPGEPSGLQQAAPTSAVERV